MWLQVHQMSLTTSVFMSLSITHILSLCLVLPLLYNTFLLLPPEEALSPRTGAGWLRGFETAHRM